MIVKLLMVYFAITTFVICDREIRKSSNEPNWQTEISGHVTNDKKIYQNLLMTTNEIENQNIEPLVREFQAKLPVLYFNSSFITEKYENQIHEVKFMKNPRNTMVTILATLKESNFSELEKLMEFVSNTSSVLIRPKCLIIIFSDSNHPLIYKEFLDQMWKNLFLDVTILNVLQGNVTIHQLNPFISYKIRQFSRQTELFPDKLKNLNEYPLKVGVFDLPPFLELTRFKNKSIDITGPDASVLKELGRMMNFKMILTQSKVKDFGIFSCERWNNTGFMHDLFHNKIQLVGVRSFTIRSVCPGISFNENMEFELDHYVFVFPLFKKTSYEISIGNSFYYSIILLAVCIGVSWTIEYVGKFDKTIWNRFVILQILLGLALDKEPEKLKERFFFMSFMIIAFFWSSNIFASLTDIQFQLKEEIQLNTLSDLVKSDLLVSTSLNAAIGFKSILKAQKLGDGLNENRFVNYENCIDVMLEERNVACLVRLSVAEYQTRATNQLKHFKYLDHYIYSSTNSFLMEPGSPYVEKFVSLYRQLTRAGLVEKWQYYDKKISKSYTNYEENSEENVNVKTTSFLIGAMVFGCSASILAFIGELLYNVLKKKANLQRNLKMIRQRKTQQKH